MAIAAVSSLMCFHFSQFVQVRWNRSWDTLAMVRPSAAAASGVATAARSERIAVTLTVNGLARTLDVEPQMTLGEA